MAYTHPARARRGPQTEPTAAGTSEPCSFANRPTPQTVDHRVTAASTCRNADNHRETYKPSRQGLQRHLLTCHVATSGTSSAKVSSSSKLLLVALGGRLQASLSFRLGLSVRAVGPVLGISQAAEGRLEIDSTSSTVCIRMQGHRTPPGFLTGLKLFK